MWLLFHNNVWSAVERPVESGSAPVFVPLESFSWQRRPLLHWRPSSLIIQSTLDMIEHCETCNLIGSLIEISPVLLTADHFLESLSTLALLSALSAGGWAVHTGAPVPEGEIRLRSDTSVPLALERRVAPCLVTCYSVGEVGGGTRQTRASSPQPTSH